MRQVVKRDSVDRDRGWRWATIVVCLAGETQDARLRDRYVDVVVVVESCNYCGTMTCMCCSHGFCKWVLQCALAGVDCCNSVTTWAYSVDPDIEMFLT